MIIFVPTLSFIFLEKMRLGITTASKLRDKTDSVTSVFSLCHSLQHKGSTKDGENDGLVSGKYALVHISAAYNPKPYAAFIGAGAF